MSKGQIYFIGPMGSAPDAARPVKVGWTGGAEVWPRLKALQVASPLRLDVITGMVGTRQEEARLHRALRELGLHLHGEWFTLNADLIHSLSRDPSKAATELEALA